MATSNKELPRGIRLRGDAYFVDVSHKGLRRTQTCATLQDAIVAQMELKTALMKGEVVEAGATAKAAGGGWTLEQARDAAILDRWKGLSSEDSMTIFANEALKFFGGTHPLKDIDVEAGKAYIRYCRDTLNNAPATIAKKVSALRVMIENATDYRNSGVTSVPVIKAPKRKNGRIRFFTDEEVGRIVQTFNLWGKHDHADAVIASIELGVRPVELYSIDKMDVIASTKHSNGVVLIYGRDSDGTKNGEYRSIPLSNKAAEVIWRRAEALTEGNQRLFPFTNTWMRHAWDNMRAHLGFEDDKDFVFYTCRHTCCSRLVMKGVPLPVVQQWMGHKAITMTMRYAHLCPTTLFAAADALNEWNDTALDQAKAGC